MPFYSDITHSLRVQNFLQKIHAKNFASSLAIEISSGYRFLALQTTAVRKIRQDNTCLLKAYFKSSVQIYFNKHEKQTSQFSWKTWSRVQFVYYELYTRSWSFFPTIIYIMSKLQLLHEIFLSWATVLVLSTLFCAFYRPVGVETPYEWSCHSIADCATGNCGYRCPCLF